VRQSILPLAGRDDLGNGYFVLKFRADEPIDAEPGQFTMVHGALWGTTPLLPRPMSLLTAGREPSILIKVVGEGTARMAGAAVGEKYELLAPLGKPWRMPQRGETPLLVGGGVGIAPLVYLARALPPISIALYGGRTQRDLPLADAIEKLAGTLTVTTEDGSRGQKGRVTQALELALTKVEKPRVYTCGPHAMMAAVAAICERAGVPCEASLEAPMGCGYGVCLGCPVAKRAGGYLYCCVDGPCVDAAAIDWAKEVF
jgi:dihydroorotate dehydrogenase electron transfer subunit